MAARFSDDLRLNFSANSLGPHVNISALPGPETKSMEYTASKPRPLVTDDHLAVLRDRFDKESDRHTFRTDGNSGNLTHPFVDKNQSPEIDKYVRTLQKISDLGSELAARSFAGISPGNDSHCSTEDPPGSTTRPPLSNTERDDAMDMHSPLGNFGKASDDTYSYRRGTFDSKAFTPRRSQYASMFDLSSSSSPRLPVNGQAQSKKDRLSHLPDSIKHIFNSEASENHTSKEVKYSTDTNRRATALVSEEKVSFKTASRNLLPKSITPFSIVGLPLRKNGYTRASAYELRPTIDEQLDMGRFSPAASKRTEQKEISGLTSRDAGYATLSRSIGSGLNTMEIGDSPSKSWMQYKPSPWNRFTNPHDTKDSFIHRIYDPPVESDQTLITLRYSINELPLHRNLPASTELLLGPFASAADKESQMSWSETHQPSKTIPLYGRSTSLVGTAFDKPSKRVSWMDSGNSPSQLEIRDAQTRKFILQKPGMKSSDVRTSLQMAKNDILSAQRSTSIGNTLNTLSNEMESLANSVDIDLRGSKSIADNLTEMRDLTSRDTDKRHASATISSYNSYQPKSSTPIHSDSITNSKVFGISQAYVEQLPSTEAVPLLSTIAKDLNNMSDQLLRKSRDLQISVPQANAAGDFLGSRASFTRQSYESNYTARPEYHPSSPAYEGSSSALKSLQKLDELFPTRRSGVQQDLNLIDAGRVNSDPVERAHRNSSLNESLLPDELLKHLNKAPSSVFGETYTKLSSVAQHQALSQLPSTTVNVDYNHMRTSNQPSAKLTGEGTASKGMFQSGLITPSPNSILFSSTSSSLALKAQSSIYSSPLSASPTYTSPVLSSTPSVHSTTYSTSPGINSQIASLASLFNTSHSYTSPFIAGAPVMTTDSQFTRTLPDNASNEIPRITLASELHPPQYNTLSTNSPHSNSLAIATTESRGIALTSIASPASTITGRLPFDGPHFSDNPPHIRTVTEIFSTPYSVRNSCDAASSQTPYVSPFLKNAVVTSRAGFQPEHHQGDAINSLPSATSHYDVKQPSSPSDPHSYPSFRTGESVLASFSGAASNSTHYMPNSPALGVDFGAIDKSQSTSPISPLKRPALSSLYGQYQSSGRLSPTLTTLYPGPSLPPVQYPRTASSSSTETDEPCSPVSDSPQVVTS